MKAILSQEIFDRLEFSLLCNWRRLGRAVEVGVDRGVFSEQFMTHWNGHNFFGIDSYEAASEFPWPRESDYLMAVARYERSGKNCKLVKTTSEMAANSIRNYEGQFFADLKLIDFIYIDASHEYEDVKRDLELWMPLLSDIGIISGHDYDDGHQGVVRAVDEFFCDSTIYKTHEKIASWYVYRNGIPDSSWRRIP